MKILGVDIGISSIGWGLIDFNPEIRKAADREISETSNSPKNPAAQILDVGVRIFTKAEHPKYGSSLALPRRKARGRRRVLARRRERLKAIKELFIDKLGLASEDCFEIEDSGSGTIFKEKSKADVWELRDAALERKLNPTEMVRVLVHIAKRRGYFSNSKSDASEKDQGKVLQAITDNKKKLEELGYKSVGQMMYREALKHSSASKGEFSRIRNTTDDYRHVVTREMLRNEVEEIFQVQSGFDKKYSSELRDRYLEIAFYQRPLKSSAEMVGNCTFEPEEKRAPKYCYSAERFVALGKIINTMMIDTEGKMKERKLIDFYPVEDILQVFHNYKEVKYQTLRKALKIPKHLEFKDVNYGEDPERVKKLPSVKSFCEKETWLTPEQKDSLIYIDEKGEERFHKWLGKYINLRDSLRLEADFKFTGLEKEYKKNPEDKKIYELAGYHSFKKVLAPEELEALFNNIDVVNEVALILTVEQGIEEMRKRLQEISAVSGISGIIDKLVTLTDFKGFNNLSIKAIERLTPHHLEGRRYNEAAKLEYGHHSRKRGEQHRLLRSLTREKNYHLTNPVVKRAFAQFRKVINAVIRKHGPLDALHIELARELKHSYRKRQEIMWSQRDFAENKEIAQARFVELCRRQPTPRELLKFRLWEEQIEMSVYSGKKINLQELAQSDKAFEIDHILPYSRTFDDTLNNKVLVFAEENQRKRNNTPFEWLGKGDEGSPEWGEFKSLVMSLKNLKKAKINKLLNTTLTRRHGDEIDEDNPENNAFIDRNLNDTQYMAKFIKNFVEQNLEFTDNPKLKQKVKVRSGMVTSHLGYVWGLGGLIRDILPPENEDEKKKSKEANKDKEDSSKKPRDNHLHHALDALVIAATTQSEVQRMSTYSARFEDYQFKKKEEKEKIKKLKSTSPFDIEELREKISGIFPSYAPRHKVTGAAHEETFYSGKTFKATGKVLVGSSLTYPVKLNRGKTLAKKSFMPRIDLFRHVKTQKYYIVPIYVADFVKPTLPQHKIVAGKDKEGNPKPWLEMDDSYEFITSIYKNDLIEVKFKKETVRGYYDSTDSSNGRVKIKSTLTYDFRRMGIQKALSIRKFEVSPLGEITEVTLPQKRVGSIHQLREIKKAREAEKKRT